MGEKIAKLGISREKDMMYYLKGDGNLVVWATPRKRPGQPKGKAQKIQDAGVSREPGYLYFIDGDGDIARATRQVGGSPRKSGKKASAPKKASAKKGSAKKSSAKKASAKKGGAKKAGGKKGKKR